MATGPPRVPKSYGYVRLAINGTSPGGEIWSTGISLAAQNDPSEDDLDSWMPSVVTIVKNWWGPGPHPVSIVVATDCFLTEVRAYKFDPGLLPVAGQAQRPITPPMSGAVTTHISLSTAMCVTLHTTRPGRHYRGRMYLPANGATLGVGHMFADADCDQVAQGFKSLIDDLNGSTLAGGSVACIVAGQVTTPGIVTSVSVDNRPDQQRRRSKSIRPTHTASQTIA